MPKPVYTLPLSGTFPRLIILSAILFLLLPIGSFAQQKTRPYTLLWRISGKGQQQPSYLFGTMHTKNKRAFNFSDSVMLAIKSCDRFALEVHPDTLMAQMFEDFYEQKNPGSLKKLLSEADYDKLAEKFEKKNGYRMGDMHPARVESFLQADVDHPDDRKTFVDAHLFGVARNMHKELLSLENTKQQYFDNYKVDDKLKEHIEDLINEDETESVQQFEKMVDIYSTGDLSKINDYIGESINDSTLIERNKVMAASIIKYMNGSSIFAAAGTAHLPGENGIIALLKLAGYTVTPVPATFTGVASNYSSEVAPQNWEVFTDKERGFSASFPSKPYPINIAPGVNGKVWVDLSTESFYGSYAVLDGADQDKAMQRLTKHLTAKGTKVISNKNRIINGQNVRDITVLSKKNYTRFMLFGKNNMIYCLYTGKTAADVNSPGANKFFNSFKTFKPSTVQPHDFITYKNDTAAFSVSLPVQPTMIKKEIDNSERPDIGGITMRIYYATDTVNMFNYIIRYNDYAPGTYIPDNEKSLDAAISDFKEKTSSPLIIKNIKVGEYKGRQCDFVIQGYPCRAQVFFRGNRSYMLMQQSISAGQAKNFPTAFFESFKLLPYVNTPVTTHHLENTLYSTTILGPIKEVKNERGERTYLRTTQTIASTNPNSGGLFQTEHASISKYYRTPSVDSIYVLFKNQISNYADTVIKEEKISVNGLNGVEYISKKNNSGQQSRYRVLIDNGDLIYLSSHIANEELFSEASNKFYNSVKKEGTTPVIDLPSSKAKLRITDLLSTDSTTRDGANAALKFYKFDKDELGDLHDALKVNYADEDSARNNTKMAIVEAIANVNNPASTDKLVGAFQATNNPETKAVILKYIPQTDKKKGYDIYFDLLEKLPSNFTLTNKYMLVSPMYDSINYVAGNFSKYLHLIKNVNLRNTALGVSSRMIDDQTPEYRAVIEKNLDGLTNYALTDLDNYLKKDSTDHNYYAIGTYLQFIRNFPKLAMADKFTAQLISRDNYDGYKAEAAIERMRIKLPVQQPLLMHLLDSTGTRYNVLEALNKGRQIAKAPAKYRTPQKFAEAAVTRYLADMEEEGIEQLKLLGDVLYTGNHYLVFKYRPSGYEEDQLVTYGPYKPQAWALNFDELKCYSDWKTLKTDWRKQSKTLIAGMIKDRAKKTK